MPEGNLYQFDEEKLQAIASELQNIGGVVSKDLQTILSELQGIDMTGEPKEKLNSCVDTVASALGKLTMPDTIGDAIGKVATNLGMQEEYVTKIFSGWSNGLGEISASIAGGIKGIANAITETPVGYENYTVSNYLSDTTKNLAGTTVKIFEDTNKLIYSFTGNNIATNVKDLASKAVGGFQTVVNNITSGNSSIGGFLSKIFNK